MIQRLLLSRVSRYYLGASLAIISIQQFSIPSVFTVGRQEVPRGSANQAPVRITSLQQYSRGNLGSRRRSFPGRCFFLFYSDMPHTINIGSTDDEQQANNSIQSSRRHEYHITVRNHRCKISCLTNSNNGFAQYQHRIMGMAGDQPTLPTAYSRTNLPVASMQ